MLSRFLQSTVLYQPIWVVACQTALRQCCPTSATACSSPPREQAGDSEQADECLSLQAGFGDSLKLVGSLPETGQWDVTAAPEMSWCVGPSEYTAHPWLLPIHQTHCCVHALSSSANTTCNKESMLLQNRQPRTWSDHARLLR